MNDCSCIGQLSDIWLVDSPACKDGQGLPFWHSSSPVFAFDRQYWHLLRDVIRSVVHSFVDVLEVTRKPVPYLMTSLRHKDPSLTLCMVCDS